MSFQKPLAVRLPQGFPREPEETVRYPEPALDPVSGRLTLSHVELEFPDLPSFVWSRIWLSPVTVGCPPLHAPTSGHADELALLPDDERLWGQNWSHPFALTLTRDVDGYTLLLPDQRRVSFDDPLDVLSRPDGSLLNTTEFMTLSRRNDLLVVRQFTPLSRPTLTQPLSRPERIAQTLWSFRPRPFGEPARLLQMENSDGLLVQLVRDRKGLLQELRLPQRSRRLLLERREDGRLSQLRLGHAQGEALPWTRYRYDAQGRLQQVQNPDGTAWSYHWSPEQRLLALEDPLGQPLQLEWDESGRCAKRSWPGHGMVLFRYQPELRLTSATTAAGDETQWQFGPRGEFAALIRPDLRQTRYQYDDHGRLHTQLDGEGTPHTFHYDAAGNLVKYTLGEDPASAQVWHWEYDARHLPTKERRPDGQLRTWQYDEQGRLIAEASPQGQLRFRWDERGFITEQRSSDGTRSQVLRSPDGDTETRLGAQSNLQLRLDGLGFWREIQRDKLKWQCHRDAVGRMSTLQHPDGTQERWERDALGRIVSHTDRNGNLWKQSWTLADTGWRITVTSPLRYRWHWQVSPEHGSRRGLSIERVQLPNEHVVSLLRTSDGCVEGLQLTDGRVEQFPRDAIGRLTRHIRPDKQLIKYRYELLAHPHERWRPAGAKDRFAWSAPFSSMGIEGNSTNRHRLSGGTAPGQSTWESFASDTHSFPLEAVQPWGGTSALASNDHVLAELEGVTAPEATIECQRDSVAGTRSEKSQLPRLKSLADISVRQHYDKRTQQLQSTLEGLELPTTRTCLDARGRLHQVFSADALLEEWHWDDLDRPVERRCFALVPQATSSAAPAKAQKPHTTGICVRWEYGDEKRPCEKATRIQVHTLSAEQGAESTRQHCLLDRRFAWQGSQCREWIDSTLGTFRLDQNRDGRLVSLQHLSGDGEARLLQYVYDANGRVVRAPDGARVYDDGHQLTQVGDTRLSWDKAGRLVSRTDATGKFTWQYDALDRLQQATRPDGVVARFSWDGLGRPVLREKLEPVGVSRPTQLRRYVWQAHILRAIADIHGTEVTSTELLWSPRQLLGTLARTSPDAHPVQEVYLWGPDDALLATFELNEGKTDPAEEPQVRLSGVGWTDPLQRLHWQGSTAPRPFFGASDGFFDALADVSLTPRGLFEPRLAIQMTEVWRAILADLGRC